jgi:cobalamin-dependent methionine synthase I
MIDFGTAKILSHRRNIQRCVTLLATELTELERQYLHKRIAEERAELERQQGTNRRNQVAAHFSGLQRAPTYPVISSASKSLSGRRTSTGPVK